MLWRKMTSRASTPGSSGSVGRMLLVFGIPLDDEEARRLVATLVVEGTPAALRAAAMIDKGIDRGLYAIGLDADERDAVTCALEEAPTDRLGELRGALLRDHRQRRHSTRED